MVNRKRVGSKYRTKPSPATQINVHDLIANPPPSIWPKSFGKCPLNSNANTWQAKVERLTFSDVFKRGTDKDLLLAWLKANIGKECPLVTSEQVNALYWTRTIVIGGLYSQPSMSEMTSLGAMKGNQQTYAAASCFLSIGKGPEAKSVAPFVYTAGKIITVGPSSINTATAAATAVMKSFNRINQFTLSTFQQRVENYVLDIVVDGDKIDLDRLHALLSKCSKYQRTNFPALIVKLENGITILVYESGHIISTGSQSPIILFYATMFFLSNACIYCLYSKRRQYTQRQALAHMSMGPAAGLIGLKAHRVTNQPFSETTSHRKKRKRKSGKDDDEERAYPYFDKGTDSDSDSSDESSEEGSLDKDGDNRKLLEKQKRKDSRMKRKRLLKERNASNGTGAISLTELENEYGSVTEAFRAALSKL